MKSASASSNRRSRPRTQYQATCSCSDSGSRRIWFIALVSSARISLLSFPTSRPWVSTMPRCPILSTYRWLPRVTGSPIPVRATSSPKTALISVDLPTPVLPKIARLKRPRSSVCRSYSCRNDSLNQSVPPATCVSVPWVVPRVRLRGDRKSTPTGRLGQVARRRRARSLPNLTYRKSFRMPLRSDLRNVAIVAHVDHGKTTLVDAMLWQSGAFRANQDVNNRVMDSMDLEREKGITILAKNTAVLHHAPDGSDVIINIIDTPGHADFGGEVERGLEMVDGVLLLVDASEGPLPQTRFVLRKALAKQLPIVVVVNKVDRPDARIKEVVEETYELFLDLLEDADTGVLDFPVVYASAKAGRASLTAPENGTMPDAENLAPLFATILDSVPAPEYEEGAVLQAHVTNLDASPYLGRLALCRVFAGEMRRNQVVAWCKQDGTISNIKLSEMLITQALDRVPAEVAGPGDIVAIAGIPDITIGETLSDPENPKPLPLITVDQPSISMTIGINTSPLAGKSGKLLTARLVRNRLDAELIGNVSIKVFPTERPDTWEVQGRGELQLAILVEMMRREGFELTVGKPQVVTREIDGKLHEPVERLTIDAPEDFVGVVTQLLGLRKGRLE